jgi:hypothetical protein
LRMLSYYISWHMKQRLAPILFQDNDKPGRQRLHWACHHKSSAAAVAGDHARCVAFRART